MAFIDVRDEHGTLLLRFDPEAHIIEVLAQRYDNAARRHVRRLRRIAITSDARLELLPLDVLLGQAITIKAKDAA